MNREEELKNLITETSEELNELSGTDFTNDVYDLIGFINDGYMVEVDGKDHEVKKLNDKEAEDVLIGIYNNLETEETKINFAREMLEYSSKIPVSAYEFFEKEAQEYTNKHSENNDDSENTDNDETPEDDKENDKNKDNNSNPSDGTENNSDTENPEDDKEDDKKDELTAIEKYELDTNEKIKEFESLETIINKYKEIENKISNMAPEEYDAIKVEIDSISEEYQDLKDELLEVLENKKNGKTNTPVVPEDLKQENFVSSQIVTSLDTTSYENEIAQKEQNKAFYVEQENKLSNEIEVLKLEIESITLEMNKPENNLRKGFFEAEIIKKQEEITKREEQISTIKTELETLDKEIEALKEIIVKKDDAEATYNLITEQYQNELDKVKQEKEDLETKKPELENEINIIKENITKLTQEISQLEMVLGANLGNGIGISEEQRKTFESALQNKKTALQLENNKLIQKEKELEELGVKLSDIDEEITLRENEIAIRNEYFKIVVEINSLIDSNEIDENKINNIKEEISNSSLDDELKQELNEKLEKTIEFVKNKDNINTKESAIDKYTKKHEELDADIKERKTNIAAYHEILKNIKDIEERNKKEEKISEDEINKVKESISKITDESLRNELNKYLENTLSMKIDNVEKQPGKWQKWLSGAAGLIVGGGIVALTPIGAAAVTLTATALKFGITKYHKHLLKKEAELKKENDITGLEKPNEKQKSVMNKFKELMKNENFIKNVNWFLTGSIIGANVMNLIEGMTPQNKTASLEPTPEPTPTETYSDIKVGSSADGMDLSTGYDSAKWSIDGVNAESLHQGIMNDGNTIIEQIRDINGNLYSSIEEARSAGLDLSDLSLKMVRGTDGAGRAWVNAADALGSIGRVR